VASTLILGSFLAGSLISLLIPIGLLIALLVWQVRAVVSVPADPAETAAHAAGAAEVEGSAGASEGTAKPPAT
jgi:hypothetical protein